MLFAVIPEERSKIQDVDFLICVDCSVEEITIVPERKVKKIILCSQKCNGRVCFDDISRTCVVARIIVEEYDSKQGVTDLTDCLRGSTSFKGPGYSFELKSHKQKMIAV